MVESRSIAWTSPWQKCVPELRILREEIQSVQECRSASLLFGWYHLRLMVEEEEEEEKEGEEDDEEKYSF